MRKIIGAEKENTKAVLLCLLVAGFICLMSFGCRERNGEKASQKKNIPVVEVEKAELRSITRNIELTGTIEAARVARIASPAEGPVLNCSIREGDRVKKGQIILTIGRKRAAEEQVNAAKKELAREEEDLQRIEQLVRSGALPAEKMEESQLRVSRAKAQLTKALESMEDYQIRAPWDGIVSQVFVTDGYFVSPRETLLEVFDPNTLIIRFAVPEKELTNVEKGMKIKATLDSFGGRVFEAQITRLYPELDRKTHTRIVEASLVKDVDVVPGMFSRLSLPVQNIDKALVIPDRSIVVTPQGDKVVFVTREGKAFRHEVRTGIEQEQIVQITEGLEAGDFVIVSGNQNLQDGMEVSILRDGEF
jgi:RND family efflux transporter MFP subunit